MVTIIDAYRSVFMYGEFPASLPLMLVGLASIAIYWVTFRVFKHASYHFVEEL